MRIRDLWGVLTMDLVRDPRRASAADLARVTAAAYSGMVGTTTGNPSSCETCRRAELGTWGRAKEDAASIVFGPSPQALRASAFAPLHALGGSWYERHKRAYIETGDPVHLTRMLRHVTTEES